VISIKRKFLAYLDEMRIITIILPFSYHEGLSHSFLIAAHNAKHPLMIRERITLENGYKYICETPFTPPFGQTSWIYDEHGGKTDLQVGSVIRTKDFDQLFFYSGEDLGVNYQNEKSEFKIWAPTATMVRIKLSDPLGNQSETLDLTPAEKGIWTLVKNGDYDGYRYTYLICVNLRWQEAVDPYAVAVTANGKQGVIIHLGKTREPKPALPAFEHPVDAVIYETHIRDFTIHPSSGIRHKGKYLGAAELGTMSSKAGLTGLSYLKALGITHIELLPINDFVGVDELGDYSDYNWGYNPLHFNAPEGSYSTNPTDPYSRIQELKHLIRTVQKQGIRVILDVVYNHVFERETSSFEKVVPGYYFRHNEYGLPSNGTGVGNDMASERLMVRKFILDSIQFWIREYGIDGLRFDLMGILDIETMNAVREMVDHLDPTFLIIGEGWELNTPIPMEHKAMIKNQAKLPRIAQFNDQFRDTIKGSTFNIQDKGFVLGNANKVSAAKRVISGSISLEGEKSIFLEPGQSVNYLESHDNHTMFDKFVRMSVPEQWIFQYHRLATTILLLSQGIPFLHSGQEFFRTKNGDGNSYRSPDRINWLDWERKEEFTKDVKYISGLMELRKSNSAFRLRTSKLIRTHLEWLKIQEPLIGYRLKDIKSFGSYLEIIVLINPLTDSQITKLDLTGEWDLLVNHYKAGANPIETLKNLTEVTINPVSVIVFGRKEK
jgi:pullulanase